MKRCLLALIVLVGVAWLERAPVVLAQYKVEGFSVQKVWGPMRAAYFDPRRGTQAVFEDAAGTKPGSTDRRYCG